MAELYLRARKAAALAGQIPPLIHADDEVSDWMQHVVIPKREAWVAQSSEGTLVGILVLEGEWIDQLYVEPALTGHGIGARLLRVAHQRRPGGLRLWTFVSNIGAQRFYERHRFTETARTDGSLNEERAADIQYSFCGRQAANGSELTTR